VSKQQATNKQQTYNMQHTPERTNQEPIMETVNNVTSHSDPPSLQHTTSSHKLPASQHTGKQPQQ